MANKIQIRRGLKANLPTLDIGEPAFCTDTKEFFIGTASGNAKMAYDISSGYTAPDSEKLGGQTPDYYAKQADLLSHEADIAAHGTMARQAIINGNFDIWQRGTTVTNPSNVTYIADRFQIGSSITGTAPTSIIHSKQSLTPGDINNSLNFYRVNVNGPGSSYGANDFHILSQPIENGVRSLCSVGGSLTISFFARSSIANKKLGVYFSQNYGAGGSPTSQENITGRYFILTPNWTKYVVTLPTNTIVGKTFGTNNDDYLKLVFAYAYGSTFGARVGDTVTETFGGSGNIDIAQIQLNAGSSALPFSPRSFEEELRMCQRYYEKIGDMVSIPRTNIIGYAETSTSLSFPILYKVEKRVTPSIITNGGFRLLPSGTGVTLSFLETNTRETRAIASVTGYTANQAWMLQSLDTGGEIGFDAEI